jgi:DNA-binding NarL/FixJ family response regulator
MTKNIIIVEDSALMRAQHKDMLIDLGHHVMAESETGKKGIEQVIHLKPDLVLLDVVLPDISAADVLAAVKKVLPQISVLIVSALDADPVVKELLKKGASGYLVKPVSAEMLSYAIDQLSSGGAQA